MNVQTMDDEGEPVSRNWAGITWKYTPTRGNERQFVRTVEWIIDWIHIHPMSDERHQSVHATAIEE
jgi:hypothetical protein